MTNKENNLRNIVNELIQVSITHGYINTPFKIGKYVFKIYYLDEVRDLKSPYQSDIFTIEDTAQSIIYEIYGRRLYKNDYYCSELNKFTKTKTISLLNNEIDSKEGSHILQEISDIIKSF